MTNLLDDFRMSNKNPTVYLQPMKSGATIPINLNGGVITGGGVPSHPTDLVTKAFVDSYATLHHDIDMSGHALKNLPANPPTSTSAVSKAYVDQQLLTATQGKNDAGGAKITNVGTPSAGTDAATKKYVDQTVDAATKNRGGNIVHNVGMPTVLTDAATKQYVDQLRDITSGDLDMHIHRIMHLAPGTDPSDAVSKAQLDTLATTLASTYSPAPTLPASSASGTIDMKGFKVTNLGTPTQNGDAVTYAYLASSISAVDIHDMGGHEVVHVADPTHATSAATKGYVDHQIATVDIHDMQNQKVTNVGTPIHPNDGATKKYVDDEVAKTTAVVSRFVNNDMKNHQVINVATPTQDSDGATKGYLDGELGKLDYHDMGGSKVTNVGAPTALNDAATKAYVATAILAASSSLSTRTFPANMHGARITNLGAPVDPTDAVTKKALTDAIATVSPNDMGNQKILNVGDPKSPSDGANLKYLESLINGVRLVNVGDPIDPQDAVTLSYVSKYFLHDRKAYEIYRNRVQTLIGHLEFRFAFSAGPHAFDETNHPVAINASGLLDAGTDDFSSTDFFASLTNGGSIVSVAAKGATCTFSSFPDDPLESKARPLGGFIYIGQLNSSGTATILTFALKVETSSGVYEMRPCTMEYDASGTSLKIVSWLGTVTASFTPKAGQFYTIIYHATGQGEVTIASDGNRISASLVKSATTAAPVTGASRLKLDATATLGCNTCIVFYDLANFDRLVKFFSHLKIK